MANLISCAVLLVIAALSGANAQGSTAGQWTLVGESGVSAMHAMLSPTTNKVIFLDKWQVSPFVEIAGAQGLASEYDMDTNVYRALALTSNTFCSAGGYLPDGTLVSVGGAKASTDNSIPPGFFSIRFLKPCTDGSCHWAMQDNVKLSSPRWYPTVEALNDGTLLIVGGSQASTQFNNANISSSSFELYPARAGITNPTPLQLLIQTTPNNLYPIVILLPDGNIFMFANTQSVVMSSDTFQVVATLPNIPGGPRSYPLTGGGVLLPLDPQNKYLAEILICGGAELNAAVLADSVAYNTCGRIKPLLPNPTWEQDTMPSIRVMPDLVHMADGNIVVVNGALQGIAGWKIASRPNYVPFFYIKDAAVGQRWTTGTPAEIGRMYHSVALTVPDGRVLVAGSNPNETPSMAAPFPSDFRVEMFTPPFLLKGFPQPVITSAPPSIKYAAPFTIKVTLYQPQPKVTVSLAQSGFVTHSTHMSQRYVFLEVTSAASGVLTVQGPPSGNVAPPSYYMLRIVENGVPSKALWVQVTK